MDTLKKLLEASEANVNKILELEGKEVEVRLRSSGTFNDYFESAYLDGKIIKVDKVKKYFVLQYDNLRLNDETMSGGPGGSFKTYKTAFYFVDVDNIDERGHHITVEMKL